MRVAWRRRAAGMVALFSSLSLVGQAPAPAELASATSHSETGGRYQVKVDKVIAPGLTFQRIKDTRGPNQIRVLRMDPTTELTLDVELANETIPGHETTSSMATRRGALAAINGDYTLLPSDPFAGRPVHAFVEDARLVTSPLVYGRNFSLSQDESQKYIGHPDFAASVTQRDSGEIFRIESWNASPVENRYTVYTPEGGTTYPPPANACAARLLPSGTLNWRTPDQDGVEQDYVVDQVRCSNRRLGRKGGIVIAAPIGTVKGDKLPSELVVGEMVGVAWRLGWPGVVDTVGGNPDLIRDGNITAENCTGSYFCDRNPRTAIGTDAAGNVMLVTVDGRQPGVSVGLKLLPLAKLMQHLGAVSALNLDGGGSTTMWVQGRIRNQVSESYGERAVGSAILVLPGPDAEEPVPFPYQTASPIPTFSPSSTASPTESPTGSPTASPSGSASPTESPSVSPTGSPTPSPSPTSRVVPAFVLRSPWDLLAPPAPRPAAFERPCAALHDPGSTGGYLDALAAGRLGGGQIRLPAILERAVEVYSGDRTCRSFVRLPR